MPEFCSAVGCSNQRSAKTKESGITFHRLFQSEGAEYMIALFPNSVRLLGTEVDRKSRERKLYDEFDVRVRFPKDKVKRRAWTLALRRREFKPNDRSVICSCHFKSEDFDVTGQTTRLKEGVIPSIFAFCNRLPSTVRVPKPRTTKTSQKAATLNPVVKIQLTKDLGESISDHQYALDPVQVKKKLTEAQERVEELQRELRNAKDRERRLKKTVKFLINALRHKNMLTKDLQQGLNSYWDLPV